MGTRKPPAFYVSDDGADDGLTVETSRSGTAREQPKARKPSQPNTTDAIAQRQWRSLAKRWRRRLRHHPPGLQRQTHSIQ